MPWAGFSPSCKDVFVQTEHWASAVDASRTADISNSNMNENLRIRPAKVRRRKLSGHYV